MSSPPRAAAPCILQRQLRESQRRGTNYYEKLGIDPKFKFNFGRQRRQVHVHGRVAADPYNRGLKGGDRHQLDLRVQQRDVLLDSEGLCAGGYLHTA